MAESLLDFRKRTAFVWDSLPREGGFVTSPGLAEKVDENGLFRPFFGNTILFDLPDEDKAWLNGIRRTLDAACGELLAEPLITRAFISPCTISFTRRIWKASLRAWKGRARRPGRCWRRCRRT